MCSYTIKQMNNVQPPSFFRGPRWCQVLGNHCGRCLDLSTLGSYERKAWGDWWANGTFTSTRHKTLIVSRPWIQSFSHPSFPYSLLEYLVLFCGFLFWPFLALSCLMVTMSPQSSKTPGSCVSIILALRSYLSISVIGIHCPRSMWLSWVH